MKVFSAEFGGVVSFGGTRGQSTKFLSKIKLSTNLRKLPVKRNPIVKVNKETRFEFSRSKGEESGKPGVIQ